jgi:hypothetical protein
MQTSDAHVDVDASSSIQKLQLLVFISAGDLAEASLRAAADGLSAARPAYDLGICYYGDSDARAAMYADLATPGLFFRRKRSKLQNFQAFWEAHFTAYDYVYLADDDIRLSSSEISDLFRIHAAFHLDVSQPAFLPSGKISHTVTEWVPGNVLRWTNFIEITAMLFSRDALVRCMGVYDARLVGYGVDYLFLWALDPEREHAYAVIDAVTCVNPDEKAKYATAGRAPGPREIETLQPLKHRRLAWEAVAQEKGIKAWKHKVFGAVASASASASAI